MFCCTVRSANALFVVPFVDRRHDNEVLVVGLREQHYPASVGLCYEHTEQQL